MREYVEKTLRAKVEDKSIDASRIPLYLRGLYSLELWAIFGVPFAVASPIESPAVKTMTKHRDALEAALGIPVAFALEEATGYKVGRMLEAGLPFITPGKQVYLPFLGIALSNEGRRTSNHPRTNIEAFSPQAQRLALMVIYGSLDDVSVTQAASLLDVTKMTASRAFDELAAADPSIIASEGRRRLLRPSKDKMTLWQQLRPHMPSPVAREHRLDYLPDASLPLGGISALCELSMLQDNPWPTLVVTKKQERVLGLAPDARPDRPEDPACVVQVLRYEPVPAPGYSVDPLSAILSLPEDEKNDPRIAGEIENVLNQVLGGGNEGNR